MSEIEKYYNGEIIVDFEEETELEKKYNEVAELYSEAVKKKIEYRKEIERLKKSEKEALDTLESATYENIDLTNEVDRLNNIINELEKHIEEELDRLAKETSNIYEDSLGKTKLVNEDIFEELSKIKNKLQELKGDGSNENK